MSMMTMMLQSSGRRGAIRMLAAGGGGGGGGFSLSVDSFVSIPASLSSSSSCAGSSFWSSRTTHHHRLSSCCATTNSAVVVNDHDDDDNDNNNNNNHNHNNNNNNKSTRVLLPDDDTMMRMIPPAELSSRPPGEEEESRPRPSRPRLQALREQLLRQDHHGPHNGNNNQKKNGLLQSFGGGQKSDCQTTTTTARTADRLPPTGVVDDDSVVVIVNRVRASRSDDEETSRTPSAAGTALSTPQRRRRRRLVDPQNENETVVVDGDVVPNSVLTDRFGRRHSYLRLSLTERCNLRCTYCMPEQGLPAELPPYLLSTEQLLSIATYFSTRGVTKFRLTGGEPTLRPDLLEIVTGLRNLSSSPTTIGMTTNGVALNERKLLALQQAGLTHINISLDTLHAEQFAAITRRPYFFKVMQTIAAAVHHTNLSVKINCVIQRGVNVDQVVPMIQLLRQFPTLSIRFIEYMPFADNAWSYDQCVPYTELLDHYIAMDESITLQPIRSADPHDTTKWYVETNTGGKVGFISSMSSHFCGSCNRLRVTADGLLKVCLFDTEKRTVDLRQALMDNVPLDDVVGPAIQRKHFSLGGHLNPISLGQSAGENRPMTRIGG